MLSAAAIFGFLLICKESRAVFFQILLRLQSLLAAGFFQLLLRCREPRLPVILPHLLQLAGKKGFEAIDLFLAAGHIKHIPRGRSGSFDIGPVDVHGNPPSCEFL